MTGLSLQVIGAGFGGTGTRTLRLALEQLGFGPCHSTNELRRCPRRAGDWLALAAADRPDLTYLLAGYQSAVDWPAAAYWRELVDACPDAKVVLTIREPRRWYDSVERTLRRQCLDGCESDLHALNRRVVWDGVFAGRFADRNYAIARFRQHAAEVVRYVDDDRLLVYRAGDGWGPLCDFLGVDTPGATFPLINRSDLARRPGSWDG